MGEASSTPAWPLRDVGLLDLARFLFRETPVPLQHIEGETNGLFLDLKGWADRNGVGMTLDELFEAAEPEGRRLAQAAVARHSPGGVHGG